MVQTWVTEKRILGMLYLFLAHTVEAFECWFNEFNGSGIVQKT